MPGAEPAVVSEQLSPQAAMNASPAVVDARNATAAVEVDAKGLRQWSSGICGCWGSPGKCIAATCCPCIVYGKIASRLDALERTLAEKNGDRDWHVSENPNPNGFLVCVLQYPLHLGWIISTGTRTALRNRYKIRGNIFTDCLVSECCVPCTLVQQTREIELEEAELRRRHTAGVDK
ncbi:PLAC8-domain-containing protein [Auriculariales sp. MPI-PUGE-AT-0066]|nr:PLAC8-domain-containing protein [Auriculariales sp. MPI-PUGE-AT-0066]